MEWTNWKLIKGPDEHRDIIKRRGIINGERDIFLIEKIILDKRKGYGEIEYRITYIDLETDNIIIDAFAESPLSNEFRVSLPRFPFGGGRLQREKVIERINSYLSKYNIKLEGTLMQEGWNILPVEFRKIIFVWKMGGKSSGI